MAILRTSLLLLAMFGISAPVGAVQSAEKTINQFKKAVGGGAARRITSTLMTGHIFGNECEPGSFSYRAASPDKLRIDLLTFGDWYRECHNGKSSWREDVTGLRTLSGEAGKALRLAALLANGRLDGLSRSRIVVRAAGKSTIDSGPAEAIRFEMGGASVKLFFDTKSHLLVKQERTTPGGLEEIFFTDHRMVDGVMEPHHLRLKDETRDLRIEIDRVEHNRVPEEEAFRYPFIAGNSPLPDLGGLMSEIVANQEKIEELRERYTFRKTEIERKLDGDGRVKGSETNIYDVTPVAGGFVERLVSRDGKALSGPELEKEDRRVQKEVEEKLKQQEKRKSNLEKARAKGEEPDEDDDRVSILTFLKSTEVTSMRRETFRDHLVIAFDFEPRKGFKPRSTSEVIISKLAGTMWIDEQARQIVRLEARLINSFKVGGGLLASISPSSAFIFEQEKVGDEVWLPSYSEVNLSARLFLLAKLNRFVSNKYSEYKKYQVESDYKLNPPE